MSALRHSKSFTPVIKDQKGRRATKAIPELQAATVQAMFPVPVVNAAKKATKVRRVNLVLPEEMAVTALMARTG